MWILAVAFKLFMIASGLTIIVLGIFFAMVTAYWSKYSMLGQKRERVKKVFPELKITKSVSGKFGEVIEGKFYSTYFKAISRECEGKIICYKIESDADIDLIAETMIWCGYIDQYEDT